MSPHVGSKEEEQRLWGRLPNVYRHALTMQQLREDPRVPFEGLPPVEQLVLAGPATHRYVKQDDSLWDQLHEGVLTTGLVRGALGLYEASAVKKLGIPSSRSGHGQLLGAYHHLCHQPPAASSTPTAAATAAAAAHNAAAVAAYNASKLAPPEPTPAAGALPAAATTGMLAARQRDALQNPPMTPADAAAAAAGQAAGASKHARRRQRKKQAQALQLAAASSPEGAGGTAAAAEGAGAAAAWDVPEERKLKKARSLGSLGLMSTCCSWGSAQEAASLLQVARAFPLSQLAEVGLCRLQEQVLPPSWGFTAGSLPPMGASPDALIQHRLPADNGQAAAAAAAAAAHGAATATAAAADAPAAAAVGPWDIDGLLARLQLAGSNSNGATGSSSGGGSGCSSNTNGTSGSSTLSNSSVCSRSTSSSGNSSGNYLIEVVEVKNSCPFGHSRRGGRLRTTELAVADRGPRQAVLPEWVPQLQLHMLCAGTPSGLLVSRSATKGTRVFRMQRDDELLRLMLLVISRLWQQHVLPGRPPPSDVYASWREHHDMMRRIGEAARGAQLVATIEEGHHLPGSDARWFLD